MASSIPATRSNPQVQKLIDDLFADEPLDPKPELTAAAVPVASADEQRVPLQRPPGLAASAPRTRPTEPAAKRDVAAFDAVGLADLGEMPGVGFGVGLHATLESSAGWLFELGFAAYPRRTAEEAAGQIGLELALGSLAICPVQWRRLLALCAGGEYGRMGVSPQNFRYNASPASRAVVDVFAGGVLRLRLAGPLFLRAAATLLVPLVRNEFFYETQAGEAQQVFRTSPIAARAELGFGVHL